MTEPSDDRIRAAAETVRAAGADQRVMICPICGFENLQGDDLCANCGGDLRTSDIPLAATPFERLLVDVRLIAVETRAPVTMPVSGTVGDALALMRDRQRACIVVVDGDRLAGIFTERDAIVKLGGAAGGEGIGRRPIREVMTADPVVLRADDSVAVAVQKMAVGGFRHIPLVDGGRPIGVVSAADVFRHILNIAE